MKKSSTFKLAVLLSVLLFSSSCKKNSGTSVSQDILTFETVQQFNELVDRVGTMSDEDFEAWEKQNSFLSFYTLAQKAYDEINFESIQSQSEVIREVTKRNKYLQLIEESNGDLTLETQLFNRSIAEQRILNQNRMVQIGNEVYKVFNDGIANTSEENREQLTLLSEDKFAVMQSNDVVQIRKKIDKKDIFSKAHDARIDDGRNRLYMGIEIQFTIPISVGNYATSYSIEYTVRPYYKTLGIWYWTKEYFEGNISCSFYYSPSSPGEDIEDYYNKRILYGERRVDEDRYLVSSNDVNGSVFYGFKWNKIDCWATSKAVPNQVCRISKEF